MQKRQAQSRETNKIEAYSLFDEYAQQENILTKAFLHLVSVAGIDFIFSLGTDMGLPMPKDYIEIFTQKKIENEDGSNIYDGRIIVNPIDIIIENKIKPNSINQKQLENFIKTKEGNNKIGIPTLILYITPDKACPELLFGEENIIWIAWESIYEYAQKYFFNKKEFEYVYNGFLGIYNNIFKQVKGIPNEELVAIIAGNFAYEQAEKENIYNCQFGRRFRDAKYFGFIKNRKIDKLYEVISSPLDDEFTGTTFKLKYRPDLLNHTIVVDKKSKSGKPVAFSMGQPRYFCLKDVVSVFTTTELEKMRSNDL